MQLFFEKLIKNFLFHQAFRTYLQNNAKRGKRRKKKKKKSIRCIFDFIHISKGRCKWSNNKKSNWKFVLEPRPFAIGVIFTDYHKQNAIRHMFTRLHDQLNAHKCVIKHHFKLAHTFQSNDINHNSRKGKGKLIWLYSILKK